MENRDPSRPVPPRRNPARSAEAEQTYNPWTVVSLVFRQLAAEGLHPVLGETGDPGRPAAELLRALGVTPAAEGSRQAADRTASELARLRAAFEAGS